MDDTLAQLVAASGPLDADLAALGAAQRQLLDCDARLATYRAALERGADPSIVASWIAEVKGDRLVAEPAIDTAQPSTAPTTDELRALVADLNDVRAVLADADPTLKAEVYRDLLDLTMTDRPADHTLAVSASPWAKVCVGGGT